jgi:hypothetical protein
MNKNSNTNAASKEAPATKCHRAAEGDGQGGWCWVAVTETTGLVVHWITGLSGA